MNLDMEKYREPVPCATCGHAPMIVTEQRYTARGQEYAPSAFIECQSARCAWSGPEKKNIEEAIEAWDALMRAAATGQFFLKASAAAARK